MDNKPKLTVVIPTYKRSSVLKMTLERLDRQTLPNNLFEVIVVDDGSNDDTSDIVNGCINKVSYSLEYLTHENTGPGYSQNRGIRQARADIVLIIADDVLASKCLLEEHLSMHEQNSGEEFSILGKVIQSDMLEQTVFQKNWDPFNYNKLEGLSELPSIYFFGCNISFKKLFLLKYGLFLQKKGAAHEDIELGYRLGKKGLRILYSEKALAYHHHPESLKPACRRAYERGINFDLLSDNIPKSYIFPIYSILSIEAGWCTYLKMLPRDIMRKCVFNRWSISSFWLPVLCKAETSKLASLAANPFTVRGTVHYFQRVGYWDKKCKRSSQWCKELIS